MSRIFKGLPALALVCLLQLCLAKVGGAEVVDRIVAEVNDEIITMSELLSASKSMEAQAGISPSAKEEKEMHRNMLEALIDRRLARAEAKRRGITLSDKEMNEAVQNFKKRNNLADDEVLNKALAKNNISMKEFKQNLADQIIQDRLVTVAVGAKSMVSEADIRRIYEEYSKEGGAQLHLCAIKIPFPPGANEAQREESKKKAEVVLEELKSGAAIQSVANKFSLMGTDMGFVSLGDLDPRLAEFLVKLKPKEVAPVLTPDGIQLIQVMERRSGVTRSYEEAAPEIRRVLTQKEMQKQFLEWVKTLREKAHVKIML